MAPGGGGGTPRSTPSLVSTVVGSLVPNVSADEPSLLSLRLEKVTESSMTGLVWPRQTPEAARARATADADTSPNFRITHAPMRLQLSGAACHLCPAFLRPICGSLVFFRLAYACAASTGELASLASMSSLRTR